MMRHRSAFSRLKSLRKIAMLMLVGMSLMSVLPAQTYANTPTTGGSSSSGGGNTARSGDLETQDANGNTKKCTEYGVLVGAMVPCIMHNIETTGEKFAEEFAKLLEPAVAAFLTLVIIFFGVKVVQGEGQVGAKAILLLLKIGFVIAILELMPSTVPMVHSAMRESTTLVANVLANEDDFHCDLTNYLKPGGDLLWAQMDCVLGKLFGFATGSNGEPNMMLAASGLGLLSGFMFSGSTGLFVFFGILGVLYTLFTLVWKTLLGYINGFIVATLLIIISPLFLPLALMQVTAQYFDKWWKGILAAMLLPIFITSYVVLALMLYDEILLAPDSEVNKLFDENVMSEMQRLNEQACLDRQTQHGAVNRAASSADANAPQNETEYAQNENIMDRIFPTLSGNAAPCISYDNIQMPTEMMNRIFYGLMKILITSIVVTQGLSMVQGSVRNISGSSMASSALDPVSTFEDSVDKSMRAARQGMEDATNEQGQRVGDTSGTDFIRSLPDMMRGGAEGLLGQRLGGATDALRAARQEAIQQIDEALTQETTLTARQREELQRLKSRISAGTAAGDPRPEVQRILNSNTQ